MNNQPPPLVQFDGFEAGKQFLTMLLNAFRRQLVTFFQYGQGARAFSLPTTILTWLMISFVAVQWRGTALWIYAVAFNLLSLIHLGHRLSLTEDELPHSTYDGRSWLSDLIPYVIFDKKKYPVWFPDDTEILIKLVIEPALCGVIGYIAYDLGAKELGIYLAYVSLGSFGASYLIHRDIMDQYYDDLDARNEARMLERQARGETITHSKGFRLARNTAKPVTPSLNLSEAELKEKIRAIEAKAKAQSQAPPTTETTRTPSPTPIISQGEVIIFDDENEVAPASTSASNGNGIPKAASFTSVRAVKPPKSKTYPK